MRVVGKKVVLVGFPGAGKTSVGKALADQHGLKWADVDSAVEQAAGCSITELIREEGEQRFRGIERQSVQEALAGGADVLSIGGGALIDSNTRREVFENCLVVHLTVSAAEATRRVSADEVVAVQRGQAVKRPLLHREDTGERPEKNLEQRIEALMDLRRGLYAGAELELSTEDRTPEEVARMIVEELKRRGALC